MEDLAAVISRDVGVLTKELEAQGLPVPNGGTGDALFFPFLSEEAARARMNLVSAAEQLMRLAHGPFESLNHLGHKSLDIGTVTALIQLGIPQMIPLDQAVPYAHLAVQTGIAPELLTRLIRYACCGGFLQEKTTGMVRHTALSSVMIRDQNAADNCRWNFNHMLPAAAKFHEALTRDPSGQDNRQCPISLALATPGQPLGTLWDHHREHPEANKAFHNACNATKSSALWSPQHILRGHQWDRVCHLVDVGGSQGHCSRTIADHVPHVQVTVQDIGPVVEEARAQLPAQYAHRIRFVEHDFFQPQPTVADCYLLRFILHNWSDDEATAIIRGLQPALRPGATLVIVDHVVPEPGSSASPGMEAMVRSMDIAMYGLLAGKERSLQDFVAIVQAAESQLVLQSTCQPPGSAASVLVFEYV